MVDSKDKKGENKSSPAVCCRMKGSKNPVARVLGEIVCGHADICEIEVYKCPVCGRTSREQETCHGKKMEAAKEEKYV